MKNAILRKKNYVLGLQSRERVVECRGATCVHKLSKLLSKPTELERPDRDHKSRQLWPLTHFDPCVTVQPSIFPSLPLTHTNTLTASFPCLRIQTRSECNLASSESDQFQRESSVYHHMVDRKRSKVKISLTFF